mgnify:CR=1 FL=1
MKLKIWNRGLSLLFVLLSLVWAINAQENSGATGETPLDLRTFANTSLMTFYNAPAGASTTGQPVAAGDINGNGCGDIVVAGQNASFGTPEGWRNNAGHLRIVMDVCVIEGIIDMSDNLLEEQVVITVQGAHSDDMLGTEVFVGDFNADGFDDILVGVDTPMG